MDRKRQNPLTLIDAVIFISRAIGFFSVFVANFEILNFPNFSEVAVFSNGSWVNIKICSMCFADHLPISPGRAGGQKHQGKSDCFLADGCVHLGFNSRCGLEGDGY